jgi:1,4-alpha-glucan branching enzyme
MKAKRKENDNGPAVTGKNQAVHFEFNDRAARKVCIAGSFNDWSATEMVRLDGGKWTIDLTLPPGAYEYRLVVDGQWTPDPNASRTAPNPFGEPNSLLIVPG